MSIFIIKKNVKLDFVSILIKFKVVTPLHGKLPMLLIPLEISNKVNYFLTGRGTADQNDLIGIAVSYDMAWQRRNGGHSSNTGHGAVMGSFTGKIPDFHTRCKLCKICDNATQSGKKPRPDDCRKNHSGSS